MKNMSRLHDHQNGDGDHYIITTNLQDSVFNKQK